MKTVGLIGGMSWESTVPYYAALNRGVNARLGKNHSAPCVLYSVDFQPVEELQYAGDWDGLRRVVMEAGRALARGGAEVAGLCTNTMHKVVDGFEEETGLPLVHIVDAVGKAVKDSGIGAIGLLGTVFTMSESFYRRRLEERFGLSVLVPDRRGMEDVNRIIYGELVKGSFRDESRARYREVMDGLAERGAEGVILGCTEIGLLVKDHELPLFDSTSLHAAALVEAAFA